MLEASWTEKVWRETVIELPLLPLNLSVDTHVQPAVDSLTMAFQPLLRHVSDAANRCACQLISADAFCSAPRLWQP
jgi:hypothetical protein